MPKVKVGNSKSNPASIAGHWRARRALPKSRVRTKEVLLNEMVHVGDGDVACR
jgi:hypothetical protein